MAKRVDLGNQFERVVEDLVKTGRYASEDEVLREGVRLIQERDRRVAEFDEAIAAGIAAADAGHFEPADVVFDRLAARYSAMATAKE